MTVTLSHLPKRDASQDCARHRNSLRHVKVVLIRAILLATFLNVCSTGFANSQENKSVDLVATYGAWSEETLAKLSIEDKIGQMLQIRFYGDYSSFEDAEYLRVKRQCAAYHIGSLILGARMRGPNLGKADPYRVASVINQLQANTEVPLIIGADLERGIASRVTDAPDFPFPMAFGAVNSPEIVARFAYISALEARSIGIQWAFAPVADINNNPANPIINTRSYGENPQTVATMVEAYIRGAHKGGVLVSAKHFPGQGNTSFDPHVGITQISGSKVSLDHAELIPFNAAIKAGVDSIMIANVTVPALEPNLEKTASISEKVIDGTLRGELGFSGLVFTDALEMQGATQFYSHEGDASGRLAVDAVVAGNDIITIPRDIEAAFNALVAAVRSGEIPEARINTSVRKILRIKEHLGLNKSRFVDLEHVKNVFDGPEGKEAADLAQSISDSAATLVRDNHSVLPVSSQTDSTLTTAQVLAPKEKQEGKLVVVMLTDSHLSRLGPTFEKELILRRPDARIFHFYNDMIDSKSSPSDVLSAVGTADQVVVGAFLTHVPGRQISSHGAAVNTIGLSGFGSRLLVDILKSKSDETAVVALGSPYLIEDFPDIKTYICTYSLTTTGEVSAIRAVFGEIQNQAELPVTLPGIASLGTSLPWPTKGRKLVQH